MHIGTHTELRIIVSGTRLQISLALVVSLTTEPGLGFWGPHWLRALLSRAGPDQSLQWLPEQATHRQEPVVDGVSAWTCACSLDLGLWPGSLGTADSAAPSGPVEGHMAPSSGWAARAFPRTWALRVHTRVFQSVLANTHLGRSHRTVGKVFALYRVTQVWSLGPHVVPLGPTRTGLISELRSLG